MRIFKNNVKGMKVLYRHYIDLCFLWVAKCIALTEIILSCLSFAFLRTLLFRLDQLYLSYLFQIT